MKLDDYLYRNRIDLRGFAGKIGCHYSYLSQIINGKRNPSFQLAKKIEEASEGKVKAKMLMKKSFKDFLVKNFGDA